MAGRLDELHRRMLAFWPPDGAWSQDDVGLLCTLLEAARQHYPEQAQAIYRSFVDRLKAAEGDRLWLATLFVRSDLVADFEGTEGAVTWVRALLDAVLPPEVGAVHLTLGRLLQRLGRLADARTHLLEAAHLSLRGIEWYSLEAFQELTNCLCRRGEGRLAFEFARCHALTSYRLGRIDASELPKAIEGVAANFGQLDYWCELNRNFAAYHRDRGEPSVAAERESRAAFRLAQVGDLDEAASSFARAAEDARRGGWKSDGPFALTCRHLGLFLRPAPLSSTEVDEAVEECRRQWLPAGFAGAWRELSRELVGERGGGLSHRRLIAELREQLQSPSPREDHGELLNAVQIAALAGRLCRQAGWLEAAARLWSAVLEMPGREDAVFVFVAEALSELWLQVDRPDPALAVAESFARRRRVLPHERFVFRSLAARAQLALGRRQAAFAGANAALGDWSRVLEGLYVAGHKSAWLQRGAPVVECALDAISEPVSWIEEDRRRREVFRLCELGKARMLTDLMARNERLTGAFSLAAQPGANVDLLGVGAIDDGDWFVPLMVQSLAFMDSMSVVVHGDDGGVLESRPRDMAPLRYAVRLPVSPERRLVVSAASLTFADADAPSDTGLYDDLARLTRPA